MDSFPRERKHSHMLDAHALVIRKDGTNGDALCIRMLRLQHTICLTGERECIDRVCITLT